MLPKGKNAEFTGFIDNGSVCDELTQREIAALLKISRSYVSRIEKKALKKIADEMKERDKPDFRKL